MKRVTDLQALSTSSTLMNIKLEYNGEVVKFNLAQELKISETPADLRHSIKESPKTYAFLLMLHRKLSIQVKNYERRTKRIRSRQLSGYLNTESSVKGAEILVERDKKYNRAFKTQLTIQDFRDTIEVAVKAFEMRSELLRTLSASERNERANQ